MKKHKGIIFWTVFMYIAMTFLFPLMEGADITLKKSLIAIPVWLLGGLGMAFVNKKAQ